MLTTIRKTTDLQEIVEDHPALANPAVARCVTAWINILETPRGRGDSARAMKKKASAAYRAALPELLCYGNILNHIACVSFGIAIDAIEEKMGKALIYTARTALGAIPKGKIDMYDYYKDLHAQNMQLRPKQYADLRPIH
jgi:hypothetical protein